MKRTLSMLAFSGLVALGLAAGVSSGQASALSGSGGAVKAFETAQASSANDVVEVNHRKRRWHRRHDRRWRHRGPRTSFFLGLGTGGYRYRPPVVVRPPYYAPPPVHVRPRYVPRHARALPTAHVRWCYDRYRSYRDSDNTFQPYHGPRKQCRSPYW